MRHVLELMIYPIRTEFLMETRNEWGLRGRVIGTPRICCLLFRNPKNIFILFDFSFLFSTPH